MILDLIIDILYITISRGDNSPINSINSHKL